MHMKSVRSEAPTSQFLPSRGSQFRVGKRTIALSNLEKAMFPKAGFKKADLISYYLSVAEIVLPYLKDRPLTLKRYPDGVTGEHFYEKNAPSFTPDWVKTFAVPRTDRAGTINYILVNDAATLVWVANLADIELHTVLAKAPKLDRPTWVMFDLDPGQPANILDCCAVALELRKLFASLKLEVFAKVSGSKGIQLYVPLNTPVTFDDTQAFAKATAEAFEQQMPDRVTSRMSKALRPGKVFIDWSQNNDHKTTVSPYSIRASRDEPFVAKPVTWEAIARASKRGDADALYFTPSETLKELKRSGDALAKILTLKQRLPNVSLPAKGSRSKPRGTLVEYQRKRNFADTPEPPPSRARRRESAPAHQFVIQKHQASHLHFDFRLAIDGALRSWAVPKGPPLKRGEKRLAMLVEDHPLEYGDFEGNIPEGNYGAGSVIVWDNGSYTVDGDSSPSRAFARGKLDLTMNGQKLRGSWALVRTSGDEKKWLLIKTGKDVKVSRAELDRSVKSGRTLADVAEDAGADEWKSNRKKNQSSSHRKKNAQLALSEKLRKAKPRFIPPMLPRVGEIPEGPEWVYEIKWDGYRSIAVCPGGKNASKSVRLYSRNGNDFTRRYPTIAQRIADSGFIGTLDGEIVSLDKQGRPSFQALQNLSARDEAKLRYIVFDILNHDGRDLTSLSLTRRRQILDQALAASDFQISEQFQTSRTKLLKEVKRLQLEGIVAKRRDSLYESGRRSDLWIKHRTGNEQEFVVGGYTKGNPFDALFVGYYDGKALIFCARVRAGFRGSARATLGSALSRLKRTESPFANVTDPAAHPLGAKLKREDAGKIVWTKPQLIVQVRFADWTSDGVLRHPQFVGIREDKHPHEVVRET